MKLSSGENINNKADSKPLVLVVEDELPLAQTIELYLRNENYVTERANNGQQALTLFHVVKPNLVILDIGLPEIDGLEVLKRIRMKSEVPIIMLTARAEEVDELLGFGLGADDYIIKPVSARKLMARVNAVLKRTSSDLSPQQDTVRVGDLLIDTYSMQVKINNQQLNLTPTEFRLLHHLALTPGRAISRGELYEVAMPESDAYERAVDVHLTNIRRKLEQVNSGSERIKFIETVRGIGYRLVI